MAGLEKSPSWAGAFHTFNDHRVAIRADWRRRIAGSWMEQQHGVKLRRHGHILTHQSGQERIMGKSGQEQITRELIYRAVTSPPRIPSANPAGRDKRIVFIDPSFTLQCWWWEGARAMYDAPKRI